jgi:16S rRNA processing protein RimM
LPQRKPSGAAPDDLVVMGHVKEPFGLQGWVKLVSYADDPFALESYSDWWLGAKGVLPSEPSKWALNPPEEIGEQGSWLTAKFAGVSERNGALALRGTQIAVSRKAFKRTKANEYYWADLIGLQVVNRSGETLGAVQEVLDLGPHQVIKLQAEGAGPQVLIPFVAAYIDAVKLKERRIEVDWSKDYS